MNKRSHAVLVYFVVYLVAIILAGLSMKYFNTFIKETYQSIFYADLVGSLVVYTACMFYNNVSIYDPYWTVQASCISVYYFINWSQTTYNRNIESCDLRALLVFILVNTWSIRLTSNLFINSVKDINEEDWRYSDYRIKFPSKIVYFFVSLIAFILIPTVLVYFGSLPIHNVFNSNKEFNYMDTVSFLVTLSGIIFESIADVQLRKAIQAHVKRTKKGIFIMDKGLWSLCRHPNYFGEVTFWFGLFLFSLSAGVELDLLQLVGPLGIFCIIMFGSLPMMEVRQMERKTSMWKDYVRRVPYKMFPLNFTGEHEKA